MLSQEPEKTAAAPDMERQLPETIFRDRDEGQSRQILTKLFRRYSRCEDVNLVPELHVKEIRGRFNKMMFRSFERPALQRHLSREAWAFAELSLAVNSGTYSDVDIGLEDKTLIEKVFYEVREAFKQNPSPNGLELKRA